MRTAIVARGLSVVLAAPLAALLAAPPLVAAADVTTSPGKAVVFETRQLTNTPTNNMNVTGQILKAKPHQFLTVTGAAHTQIQAGAQSLGIDLVVNGFLLSPGFVNLSPVNSNTCSVSGQWIADLDQLEADHPGLIIGQPLDLTLEVIDGFSNVANVVDASMIARMEKKK